MAVSAFGVMVKPCSATTFWFEAEAVRPHRRTAARENRALVDFRGAAVRLLLLN
jgi:hypothetical protein